MRAPLCACPFCFVRTQSTLGPRAHPAQCLQHAIKQQLYAPELTLPSVSSALCSRSCTSRGLDTSHTAPCTCTDGGVDSCHTDNAMHVRDLPETVPCTCRGCTRHTTRPTPARMLSVGTPQSAAGAWETLARMPPRFGLASVMRHNTARLAHPNKQPQQHQRTCWARGLIGGYAAHAHPAHTHSLA